MKNIILKFVLVTLICSFHLSCDKENDQNEEIQNISPPGHIEINDVVLDNIPSFLETTGTNLIYKEEISGREWELTIGNFPNVSHATQSNVNYTYDQIQIETIDLRNNNTIFVMLAKSQLDQNSKVVNSITSILRYDQVAFTSTSIYIDENGEKTPGWISAYAGDITLGNKVFNDVYKIRDDESFSRDDDRQIYINSEFGVVGFTGPTGELWVFDRFEE